MLSVFAAAVLSVWLCAGSRVSQVSFLSSDPEAHASLLQALLPGYQLLNSSSLAVPGSDFTSIALAASSSEDLLDFELQIGDKMGDYKTYEPFMDINIGFWAQADVFDSVVYQLEKFDMRYLSFHWTLLDLEYYSVLFNIPNSQIIVEVLTDDQQTLLNDSDTMSTNPRYFWTNADYFDQALSEAALFPVKISKAVSNLTVASSYYEEILEATSTIARDVRGLEMAVVGLPGADLELQLVHRLFSQTHGDLTVEEWEIQLQDYHQTALEEQGDCAWDEWMSNYILWSSSPLENLITTLSQGALPWFVVDGTVWTVDPSGYSIRIQLLEEESGISGHVCQLSSEGLDSVE